MSVFCEPRRGKRKNFGMPLKGENIIFCFNKTIFLFNNLEDYQLSHGSYTRFWGVGSVISMICTEYYCGSSGGRGAEQSRRAGRTSRLGPGRRPGACGTGPPPPGRA